MDIVLEAALFSVSYLEDCNEKVSSEGFRRSIPTLREEGCTEKGNNQY